MINRLSFVKVFKYLLRKIQEICNPTAYISLYLCACLWIPHVCRLCSAALRAAGGNESGRRGGAQKEPRRHHHQQPQ